MQKIKLNRNKQNGIDATFTDGQHNVHVQTGDKQNSLNYWKELKAISEEAIASLTKPAAPVHVILISPTFPKVRHKSYRPKH
jgi:hypothetical protein